MKYNFDKMTDRSLTSSLKWDVKDNELPMWVADMDFETAPEIKEALKSRVDHGIFGYNTDNDEFFDSIQEWWHKQHHFYIEKEWMMFCSGVVPAISSIVRKMTSVGENVLIQSPVYNIFYNSILNNGRHVLSSDLIYKDNEYHIDFNDLERKLSLPQTTLMILCNPHNPIGKIWTRESLDKIGQLCKKHQVIVLSDEIHCDITHPDYEYVPFASVSNTNLENSITCISVTKTFNIAGLQTSCIVVPNDNLRHKVNRGINTDEVAEPNSFAQIASISALTKGQAWLKELREYIQINKDYAYHYIDKYIDDIHVIKGEATYLLWIDCSFITLKTNELCLFIKEKTGLIVSSGEEYGDNGKGFIRMNIACPKERLKDGLTRLQAGINEYKKEIRL